MTRREIILDVLREQYPALDIGALDSLAEDLDKHWHILKKDSLDGVNGEWTVAGHIQSYIWYRISGASQAASSAHKILSRMAKEGVH